jgi:group I intron endonuclease
VPVVDIKQSGGVYQILNTATGKRYVGSAKRFSVRMSKHLSALKLGKHHARHLQASFKKHGPAVFVFSPILVCAPEDLLFYEQRAIDTLKPEYNSSPTAGNTLGVRCSDERKRKIGDAHRGRKQSAESNEKRRQASLGRKISELTRAKLVAAQAVKSADPEWRRKISAGKTGKPMSDAHKETLRASKTGKSANLTEESRLRKNRKIAEANRTRVITDEHRRNASEAQKLRSNIERFLYLGELKTVLELSVLSGIGKQVLRKRLNAGWSVESSVATKVREPV